MLRLLRQERQPQTAAPLTTTADAGERNVEVVASVDEKRLSNSPCESSHHEDDSSTDEGQSPASEEATQHTGNKHAEGVMECLRILSTWSAKLPERPAAYYDAFQPPPGLEPLDSDSAAYPYPGRLKQEAPAASFSASQPKSGSTPLTLRSLSTKAVPFIPAGGAYAVARVEEQEGTVVRWHRDAARVGTLSGDGKSFTHHQGRNQLKSHDQSDEPGEPAYARKLSPLCMVTENMHRRKGCYEYKFRITGGMLGRADGAGFAFDSTLRRRNFKLMRCVFFNAAGNICLRHENNIKKLYQRLPPLTPGLVLRVNVDLHAGIIMFTVCTDGWNDSVFERIHLAEFWSDYQEVCDGGGFFCAVVSGMARVSIA